MRYRLFGWVLAAGMVLAFGSASHAQVFVSSGTLYNGLGGSLSPTGWNYGYRINGYGNPYYAPAVVTPPVVVGTTTYSSGYGGFAASTVPVYPWYGVRSYVSWPGAFAYPAYGYTPYPNQAWGFGRRAWGW